MDTRGTAFRQRAWWPWATKAVALVLAASFTASVVRESVLGHDMNGRPHAALVASAALNIVGLVILLAARNRSPGRLLGTEVVLAVVAHVLTAPNGGSNASSVLVAVAQYAYAVRRPTSDAVTMATVVSVVIATAAVATGSVLGAVPADLVLITAATAIALNVRSRRALTDSLRVRAEHAEREQHWMADRAVSEERVRIARELHDVIAHHVSLLVVQAGAVRETLPPDHPTRVVLDSMITGGRQAMTEMRDMLDALRLPTAPAASTAATVSNITTLPAAPPVSLPPPRHPQPGIGDIPDLVEGARKAGQMVDLYFEGHHADVLPTLTLTVYRIVQEALTNVVKHAPGAPTTVRVARRSAVVEVWVRNGQAPAPTHTGQPGPPASGHGLLGMHERVSIAGGRLVAGPAGDGFSVHAWLPVAPAALEDRADPVPTSAARTK